MLAIADGPRAPSASMRLASKAMSIAIAIGMVAASLLLSGCGFALFDEQQLGDDAAHTIMVAIEEDDMDALFPLLAPCALEADDLQEGFSYAHSVLDGPVVSIERHGPSYGKQVRGFIWSRSILGRYDVATESGDYLLSFEYYPQNTIDRSKQGICRIYFDTEEAYTESGELLDERRQTAEEHNFEEPEWNYGALFERPGIYHPSWQTERMWETFRDR